VISVFSSIAALVIFNHYYTIHQNPAEGRSLVFASFAVNSMIYIFAYRSMRRPLYKMNKLTANKPLLYAVGAGLATALAAFFVPGIRNLLGLVPLSVQQWGMIAGIAFSILLIVEVGKAISVRLHINGHN
jgi:Ca2+-transporting ATPase